MKHNGVILDAADGFAEFHGEEPELVRPIKISPAFFTLGKVLAITYKVIEDGREVTYHHDFDTAAPLAISSDGRNALILRGEWEFTERGFEG